MSPGDGLAATKPKRLSQSVAPGPYLALDQIVCSMLRGTGLCAGEASYECSFLRSVLGMHIWIGPLAGQCASEWCPQVAWLQTKLPGYTVCDSAQLHTCTHLHHTLNAHTYGIHTLNTHTYNINTQCRHTIFTHSMHIPIFTHSSAHTQYSHMCTHNTHAHTSGLSVVGRGSARLQDCPMLCPPAARGDKN